MNCFIEDVLEGTFQLFLLIQESVDVVLSALLELSEGLLRCLLKDIIGSLLLAVSFFAARLIDLDILLQLLVSIELELLNDEILLTVETADSSIGDEVDLVIKI